MSDPFIGEIKQVGFTFAPKGWALCNGQLLSIAQNQALFSILGTTYGGDGRVTFGLPNLQGRVPVHVGPQSVLGQVGGEANHTLTLPELPAHTHNLNASSAAGTVPTPAGNGLAATADGSALYASTTANVQLASGSVTNAGGAQPHNNQPPYLVVNYIIALVGIFPSRN